MCNKISGRVARINFATPAELCGAGGWRLLGLRAPTDAERAAAERPAPRDEALRPLADELLAAGADARATAVVRAAGVRLGGKANAKSAVTLTLALPPEYHLTKGANSRFEVTLDDGTGAVRGELTNECVVRLFGGASASTGGTTASAFEASNPEDKARRVDWLRRFLLAFCGRALLRVSMHDDDAPASLVWESEAPAHEWSAATARHRVGRARVTSIDRR